MSPRQQLEKLRSRAVEERRRLVERALKTNNFGSAVEKVRTLQETIDALDRAIKDERPKKAAQTLIGSPIQAGAKSEPRIL